MQSENDYLHETDVGGEERIANTRCPWCKSKNASIKSGIFYCSRCSYQHDVSVRPEIKVIGWTTGKDEDYPYCECKTSAIYDAIVREVREKGYSFSWGEHQSDNMPCTPIINNGYKIYCGPRTWSDIMAVAHGDDDSYGSLYAKYFFGLVDDSVYPKKSVDYQQIIPFEIEE